MDERLYDWFITFISFLIYIYIFTKTMNTECFNTSDLSIALVGVVASVWLLFWRAIRR